MYILKKDVLCVIPTGYGKSLVFHLLPGLLFARDNLEDVLAVSHDRHVRDVGMSEATSIIIVVSPLNSLMGNQISRLRLSGASVLGIKAKQESQDEDGMDVDCDFRLCSEEKLRCGQYHIVFAHPESFVIVILIYHDYRGDDFRTDYGKLGVLCAIFPDVPVLAMTATANIMDRRGIMGSLGLKSCKEVNGNPDRTNIFYEKLFRHGKDADSIEAILKPICFSFTQRNNKLLFIFI